MISTKFFAKRFPALDHLEADVQRKILEQARYETFRASGSNTRWAAFLAAALLVLPLALGGLNYLNALYFDLSEFWLGCFRSAVMGSTCIGLVYFYADLMSAKVNEISAHQQSESR